MKIFWFFLPSPIFLLLVEVSARKLTLLTLREPQRSIYAPSGMGVSGTGVAVTGAGVLNRALISSWVSTRTRLSRT